MARKSLWSVISSFLEITMVLASRDKPTSKTIPTTPAKLPYRTIAASSLTTILKIPLVIASTTVYRLTKIDGPTAKDDRLPSKRLTDNYSTLSIYNQYTLLYTPIYLVQTPHFYYQRIPTYNIQACPTR